MKQTDKQSFQKTLLLATTMATLGASLGVTVSPVQAASPGNEQVQGTTSGAAAVQAKIFKNRQAEANQLKIERSKKGVGANQLKIESLKKGVSANQLKIDKSKTGAGNTQLPAVQK